MKFDLPIPAELTGKLDESVATMKSIELLLRQLIIVTEAQLTVDQRNIIERKLEKVLAESLRGTR